MAHPHALLHEKRFRTGWRLLFALLAAVAGIFAVLPGGAPALDFDGADKLDHLLAFASMGATGLFSVASRRRGAWGVAAGLLAYGAVIELVQSQIPSRTASAADLLADAGGIALGLALAGLLRRRWPPDV